MVVLWLYAGDGLFEPLHRIVPVKCHCEWWSARVCCKGTSISMSCSTVNAKPFHSSEFSPLAPTLGHRVRTDNKWECYQTYPGKGNIDVWSCSGGGITNSFRCECAIFCAACLCLSALCQLTLKGKSLKVEPGKKKKKIIFCVLHFVTQPWDFQKHPAVNPVFGSGYESV